jgi:hypothetical protein
LKGFLAPGPHMAMMKISKVLRKVCNKIWDPSEFESFQNDVIVHLSLVEMHFLPAFFDIRTHLLYHLVEEVDLCGLVANKWMYLVEKYIKNLKNYMHNMARSLAAMAKGYIRDECLGFITKYLGRFEVVL